MGLLVVQMKMSHLLFSLSVFQDKDPSLATGDGGTALRGFLT